jgi:MoaA/NifB/PqqE/SkfB family radical SAM enzyme
VTIASSIYHTYKRYRSLRTDRISTLPIAILMPHSACNCRCVMCDIWKDNKNLRQLAVNDIENIIVSLKKLETQQVLMSGGEALLNPNFFRFCEMMAGEDIRITLLSTGLTLRKHAESLVKYVNDIIVSLDGPETLHDTIRNIPGAFSKLSEGISAIRNLDPSYPISGRTVIHRLNFKQWPQLIRSAKEIGLDSISFLPADVSSHAFNREVLWTDQRQDEILPTKEDLPVLKTIVEQICDQYAEEIATGFIAERPEKLLAIHTYYEACYGLTSFPYKKCNAPWVSVVVEADGTVRPCFFHASIGNIHDQSVESIINSEKAISFRKGLDMSTNDTCVKCVCYLNLPPRAMLNT